MSNLKQPGPAVGHATTGIHTAATQATEPADTVEAMRARLQAVATELRARVHDHEHGVDGPLPVDHPMALWCDSVSNIAHKIEDALRTPAPARSTACDDGPSIREAATVDRNWDIEKAGE